MRKITRIIVIFIILMLVLCTNISAHGGNITGWKDKNSKEITKYNEKYYGYHKENGIRHYHQVKWDEEKERWTIVNPAVYYDENFNIIDALEGEESEKIEVKYYASVDGDTAKFDLNGEVITVRFLGINTPETVSTTVGEEPYGKEASNYTKEKLENATKIELEYDPKADEKDKYNRVLAWIWVDGSLLQKELVSNGLAETYMLQNNYRYASILQLAEEEAKSNKKGIWSEGIEQTKETEESNTDSENNENNINAESYENSHQIDWHIVGIILVLLLIIIKMLIRNKK